jgi:hypothetical protein
LNITLLLQKFHLLVNFLQFIFQPETKYLTYFQFWNIKNWVNYITFWTTEFLCCVFQRLEIRNLDSRLKTSMSVYYIQYKLIMKLYED